MFESELLYLQLLAHRNRWYTLSSLHELKAEETSTEGIDIAPAEIESTSAFYSTLSSKDFPDSNLSRFFEARRDCELVHQRPLKNIRTYKKVKNHMISF